MAKVPVSSLKDTLKLGTSPISQHNNALNGGDAPPKLPAGDVNAALLGAAHTMITKDTTEVMSSVQQDATADGRPKDCKWYSGWLTKAEMKKFDLYLLQNEISKQDFLRNTIVNIIKEGGTD